MPLTFTTAILRQPCCEIVHGITSAKLGKPDFARAVSQHQKYAGVLEMCGLQVRMLESDPRFPDSLFIEDIALCTPACAIITRPGAPTRTGETEGMREILSEYYPDLEEIASPGTLEAGDVMMVGMHFYIGLSARTNREGAGQLMSILKDHGLSGSMVPLKEVLHLKTAVSYLEGNTLLVCGEFIGHPGFERFNKIEVTVEEAYAANSLWINGTVLVPEGFPETRSKIEREGYPVITLNMSEFQKLDGGLSCLSLRF
ncbi:MAG: arginine deiminase family protein [Bacteroidales bacterium]|jgi:dimethylargininase